VSIPLENPTCDFTEISSVGLDRDRSCRYAFAAGLRIATNNVEPWSCSAGIRRQLAFQKALLT
jgi:hypothetical protein